MENRPPSDSAWLRSNGKKPQKQGALTEKNETRENHNITVLVRTSTLVHPYDSEGRTGTEAAAPGRTVQVSAPRFSRSLGLPHRVRAGARRRNWRHLGREAWEKSLVFREVMEPPSGLEPETC